MPEERMRLLGLVRSESSVGHAERSAQPYNLNTGDNEWFLENISCQYACPAYTDVARYIAHIAAEDYDESYRINLEDNVFPGLLGRVCARPCEPACRRGRIDKPIATCWLQQLAAGTLSELRRMHDAVFLACGTQDPQKMDVPGEEYDQIAGLYPGLWYMERINLHNYPLVGRRVAVIGGGFTAMDCSRSSLRMGAEKVYVLYRRSRNEMLVYEEEAREAEIEGIEYRFLTSQIEVLHDDQKVTGLRCIRN